MHDKSCISSVFFLLVLPCLISFCEAIPSLRDKEFPLASSVRYHLPPELARQAGCDSHALGSRCCPHAGYTPAWEGALVPFVREDDSSEDFGVQRCLRATSCEAAYPGLKTPGPCQPWQHSRLAMIVMRERSISAYSQHTEAVNAVWAARWNYSLVVVELADDVPCETSISWERVEIVRRHLAHHDYVFFVDADIIVVEHEKPWLEDILRENPDADIIACKDSGFVMPDPKRNIGGASFANFGAFILRNTPWTHEFIRTWWNMQRSKPIYSFQDPHEQAAFGDYYGIKKEQGDEEWLSHVAILETTSFNSLDPFYRTHKKGMPIIHTTMRLPRMRQTLFARVHAGLCALDPDLYINSTWLESIVFDDAKIMADEKPNNAEAQMIFASSLQGRELHDEALIHIERAVKAKPNDMYYLSALASAYEREERYDEAMKLYDKALNQPIQLQSIVRKRSNLLLKLGKTDEAINSLNKRIEDDPDPFHSLFQMGTTLLKQKKLSEAISFLQRARKANPDNAGATLNLGIALQETGNHKEAIKLFNKALKLPDEEGEHLRAYLSKARSALATEQPEMALDCIKQLDKKYPNNQFKDYAKKLKMNAERMLKD